MSRLLLHHPTVVVLDIDDTVYLERDYVRSGFQAVDQELQQRCGISGFAPLAWERFRRGDRGYIFDAVLAELGGPTDSGTIREMVNVYRRHEPAISLLPDAANLISSCGHYQIPIAVITDGPAASQRAKIAALGLDRVAEPIVVTAEHGAAWTKPAEHAFREVELSTGVEPGRAVYLADNPAKDFEGALNLGWMTVRVRRPGSLHRSVPTPEGIPEIADLAQVVPDLGVAGQRRNPAGR